MDGQCQPVCPLCSQLALPQGMAWRRPIWRCTCCDLRFVPEPHWVTHEEEIARYRQHRNRVDDAGYVRFLQPVMDCLRQYGVRGRVLDYGAGPEPVLVTLLIRAGYSATGFDPNFPGGDTDALGRIEMQGPFQAIVSTEVFEHFRRPAVDIPRLSGLLDAGGLLIVMTSLVTPSTRMEDWAYANDMTHVAFYSEATFRHIARRWGFDMLEQVAGRLVVLRKKLLAAQGEGVLGVRQML